MASEVIKLNLIPKGEMPVFHASQFDTGRLITCELYRGEDAYSVPEGYTVELHCRKVDNNIVTMASTLINDNVVTFTSTEQLTACNGNNLCEVAILDEGYRIGTLNFILEVEIDPLKGGITSTSEIHNLETQIEEITTEIVGENYYNKTEVDDLLDAKADASSVYTKSETDTKLALKANAADVYTKSQTDILLNAKADLSDLPDMTDYYTKTATDALLDEKADADTVTAALATKADKSDTYTKEQVDDIILGIMPVDTASGATAEFNTQIAAPLVSVIADITATGGGGTPSSPVPIVGYTSANINANGNIITITFGQTVFGGVLDVTRGKLHVTWGGKDMGDLTWVRNPQYNNPIFLANIPEAKNVLTSSEVANTKCEILTPTTAFNCNNTSYDNCYSIMIYFSSNYNINVVANAYNDVPSFISAVTGKMLIYELATPFDIDITPEVISAVVGANNVSSNTGAVTVRFKTTIDDYINGRINRSISNRLLLSSVNSDIIKEKSKIKEQSDIIEDNERGEENE